MKTIEQLRLMQDWSQAKQKQGLRIGFVPTMGALHAGHLSLVAQAKKQTDVVVVSIFVNPTQFGPGEDYQTYPRTLAEDETLLKQAGIDVLFLPTASELYPQQPPQTWVTVANLDEYWCGAKRPGHFRGVTTVVSKLFHAVFPQKAFFGEKDFQQLAIIKKMTKELCFHTQIVSVPTLREPNGLAMSSRNRYLSASELEAAAGIYAALLATQAAYRAGERRLKQLATILEQGLSAIAGARLDYAGFADPITLKPMMDGNVEHARALCAVYLGNARLIDNIDLNPA